MLGYSAVAIAGALFYFDWKFGWEATKVYTAPAVVAYFLLNGAFTYWLWWVESGLVYEGEGKGGKVRPKPPCFHGKSNYSMAQIKTNLCFIATHPYFHKETHTHLRSDSPSNTHRLTYNANFQHSHALYSMVHFRRVLYRKAVPAVACFGGLHCWASRSKQCGRGDWKGQ